MYNSKIMFLSKNHSNLVRYLESMLIFRFGDIIWTAEI